MRLDSLQGRLYRRIEKDPEGRAIAFYRRDGHFEWITYQQFYRSGQGAAGWLSEQGLRRGDVCILVMPSGQAAATLLLGVLLAGGVPLFAAPPLLQGTNTDLQRVLDHAVRRTGARVVVHDEMLGDIDQLSRGKVRTRFAAVTDQSCAAVEDEPGPRVLPAELDIAAMQLTSGTTGLPRICVWHHREVLAALDGMVHAMKLSPASDVCFNWTPLYHDMGLVNNFLLCLTTGVPMVFQNPTDFVQKPASWLRGLSDTGATISWSPNFGFAMAAERVKDSELEGIRLDSVRSIWNAAERIHLSSILSFHRRFEPYGIRLEALKTNFGCAENIGGATFSDVDGNFVTETVDSEVLWRKRVAQPPDPKAPQAPTMDIVSVGRPNKGMGIEILSPTGKPLPEGHVGEIGLRTPSRMVGYLKDARATRRAIRDGILRTGDLGYVRGENVFWVGRGKERINLRGSKYDPSDFESALVGVTGLRKGCFAVFGIDDPGQGTQRVVIVSEVKDAEERDVRRICDEIRNQVFSQLGVTVHEVLLVPPRTLIKTSSGKRRHRHFASLYRDGAFESLALRG